MNLSLVRRAAWLGAIALVLALAGARAHAAAPVGVRNIVLVHGAFADGSSWSRVIPLLQRKGYHVTAVQLPLTGLADDLAATRRVIEREPGAVILVGHSWGGVVVTEAGNDPKVAGLVYLSALVPDDGESASALLDRFKAPMEGFEPDASGLAWLDDPLAFHGVMASDLPIPLARALAAVQRPIAARSFADTVSHAAWHDKPGWFLVTEDDHALQPRVQRAIARRIHATTTSIKSSHLSMFSHPRQVAALIESAARGTRR
jgi:pimeloyl-ACP methyl ester carboxylesterase